MQLRRGSALAATDSGPAYLSFGVSIGAEIVRSAVQAGLGSVSTERDELNYPRNFSQGYLLQHFLVPLTCEVLSGVRCVSFGFSNSCSKGDEGSRWSKSVCHIVQWVIKTTRSSPVHLTWMSSVIRSGDFPTACFTRVRARIQEAP